MSREDERERGREDRVLDGERDAPAHDAVVDTGASPDPTAGDDRRKNSGRAAGLRGRLRNPVSKRGLLLALALSIAGVALGGAVPLLGGIGRLFGVFLAAFVLGLASSRRRYAEAGIAGALATGGSFLATAFGTVLFPVVADYGPEIVALGVGAGLVVSLLGHYLGRDLRAGLTRDLP